VYGSVHRRLCGVRRRRVIRPQWGDERGVGQRGGRLENNAASSSPVVFYMWLMPSPEKTRPSPKGPRPAAATLRAKLLPKLLQSGGWTAGGKCWSSMDAAASRTLGQSHVEKSAPRSSWTENGSLDPWVNHKARFHDDLRLPWG